MLERNGEGGGNALQIWVVADHDGDLTLQLPCNETSLLISNNPSVIGGQMLYGGAFMYPADS